MTDDSKATPRPWKAVEEAALDYRPDIIATADGDSRIAIMYGGGPVRAIGKPEERANANLIVTAVNAHDALVAERDRLRRTLDIAIDHLESIKSHIFWHMVRHADERGDRKILGEAKEHAIASIARIREALGDG